MDLRLDPTRSVEASRRARVRVSEDITRSRSSYREIREPSDPVRCRSGIYLRGCFCSQSDLGASHDSSPDRTSPHLPRLETSIAAMPRAWDVPGFGSQPRHNVRFPTLSRRSHVTPELETENHAPIPC